MGRIIIFLLSILICVSCTEKASDKMISADMIITNAKVAVMDSTRSTAEAIAVKDGIVLLTVADNVKVRVSKSAVAGMQGEQGQS